MMESRRKGRRSPARAFRPTVDGRLEARALLSGFTSPFGKNYRAESAYLLKHPSARAAKNLKAPPQLAHTAPHFNNTRGFHKIRYIGTQTARGGQNVEVTALDGSHYMISLSYTSNTLATNGAEGANGQAGASTSTTAAEQISPQSARYPQPIGTVRAYPMSNGRVGIIVDGSTPNTDLTINPLGEPQRKGFAHSFAYGESARNHIVNIGQLTVTSGQIGAIEGFQDAVLSGPLVATGTAAIDRIALDAILPGASITTGGDVNTLDVLNGITLTGTNINIGRDVNLLNVGGSIELSNGSAFLIGRDIGLVSQPPKGTGTGSNVLLLNFNTLQNTTITTTLPESVGTYIEGNVVIGPGSTFSIGQGINNGVYIEGSLSGYSRMFINENTAPTNPPVAPANPTSPKQFEVMALGGVSG
ncbi:MAG: hypothetical protein ACHRXM_22800 [Isosphaerales bacterium]